MHSASPDTVHFEDALGQYKSMNQQITRTVLWFLPLKSPFFFPFPGIIPVFYPLALIINIEQFLNSKRNRKKKIQICQWTMYCRNYFTTFLQHFLKEISFCNLLLSFFANVWWQSWHTETSLYFYTPVVCHRSE